MLQSLSSTGGTFIKVRSWVPGWVAARSLSPDLRDFLDVFGAFLPRDVLPIFIFVYTCSFTGRRYAEP